MSALKQEALAEHVDVARKPVPSMAPLAALVGVSKRFGHVSVLDQVDLSLHPDEIVVVSGPSGSGKSTLLRTLLGLEQPDEGEVWLLGEQIGALTRRRRTGLLREVGVGFQDPLLDNARSVLENLVALGRINRRFDDRRREDLERLAVVVDGFELAPLLDCQAAVLSGGQKLRVALGRALLSRPRVLLLDEPTHMVDPGGKGDIYRKLERFVRGERLSTLIVSHDDEARKICDRVLDVTGALIWAAPSRNHRSGKRKARPAPVLHPLPRQVPGFLKDEAFRLGTVTFSPESPIAEVGPLDGRHPARIRLVNVQDPYVEAWSPSDRLDVTAIETDLDRHAHERRLAGKWERRPGTAYALDSGDTCVSELSGWGDPVASTRFYELLDSPAVSAWRTLIPSAAALSYLADPWYSNHVHTADGDVPIDDVARRMFSLVTDAVAIRSRASLMAELVKFTAINGSEREGQSTPLRWMSVACGTALPVVTAAAHVGIRPNLLLLDFDIEALKQATQLAESVRFRGQIDKRRMNIFDLAAMEALRLELAELDALPHLIDVMGIFEYTGSNLGVDPVAFLRSVWQILRPGGIMILGQMLDTRPLPDFTMGVVPWPYVEMRSLRELLAITTEAGIPLTCTDVYLPRDGVYAVLHVRKPSIWSASQPAPNGAVIWSAPVHPGGSPSSDPTWGRSSVG